MSKYKSKHSSTEIEKVFDSCKGYFLTEEALNNAFPPGPSLKGGEFAFVDDSEVGIYLFQYTPVRNKWVRDSSINFISKDELGEGILLKSYATLNPIEGDLRFKKRGHKIDFEVFDGLEGWSLITSFGSVTTDAYYLKSDAHGSMIGIMEIDKQGNYHNIFRRYFHLNEQGITETSNEFGSLERKMCLSSNSDDGVIIAYPTQEITLPICETAKDMVLGKGVHVYPYPCEEDIEFDQAVLDVVSTCRARIWIMDVTKSGYGELVYESATKRDAIDTNGNLIIDDDSVTTTGVVTATLPRVGYMSKGREYMIYFEVFEGEVKGGQDDVFVDFTIIGTRWKEEIVATREWVSENGGGGGNTFNSIELKTDENDDTGITITSASQTNTHVASYTNGRNPELSFGSYGSELNLISLSGFVTLYSLGSEEGQINLGTNQAFNPIQGETFATNFTSPDSVKMIVGMQFGVLQEAKIRLRITRLSMGEVLHDGEHTLLQATPYTVSLAGPRNEKYLQPNEQYRVDIELLSGSIMGDEFPTSILQIGDMKHDSLAATSNLLNQVDLHLSKESFKFNAGAITSYNNSNWNQLPHNKYVVPRRTSEGMAVNSIAENVFTMHNVGDEDWYIDANLTSIHPSNFRDDRGGQTNKLICNPQSVTYTTLRDAGYIVSLDGRVPETWEADMTLGTDGDGKTVWQPKMCKNNAIYLTDTMRVIAVNNKFSFQRLIAEVWEEVGSFE